MTAQRFILASASPRRQELLARLLPVFEVRASGADESTPTEIGPARIAVRLAEAKARVVAAGVERGLVLGADTLIDLDGRVLGKPKDSADAESMLQALNGREHKVVTGLCLLDAASGRCECRSISTDVRMKSSTIGELKAYVKGGEPLDKAGAYAIQGEGGRLVVSVAGCYSNVVGLPLCETASLLRSFGVETSREALCLGPNGEPCPRSRSSQAEGVEPNGATE